MSYQVKRPCVSCGKNIIGDRNHKCSQRHEAAREAAQTRALNEELRLSYSPPRRGYNQRLTEGFLMMRD